MEKPGIGDLAGNGELVSATSLVGSRIGGPVFSVRDLIWKQERQKDKEELLTWGHSRTRNKPETCVITTRKIKTRPAEQ